MDMGLKLLKKAVSLHPSIKFNHEKMGKLALLSKGGDGVMVLKLDQKLKMSVVELLK